LKAAVLKGIENLDYCDFPAPVPGKNDMVIKIRACSVCGTDVKTYRHGHRFIRYPRILGHELAGEVAETGSGVKSFSAGDRVQVAAAIPCGKCFSCVKNIETMCENLQVVSCHYHGGFAEYMLVPEFFISSGCVNKIPENLSWEEAALAEPLACVINGLERSSFREGESILIIGSGPMGCFHSQMSVQMGAEKVFICDTDVERLRTAGFTKASAYINPCTENAEQVIRESNSGRLADHVMVVSGSAAPGIRPLELVAPRGTVNLFGGYKEDQLEGSPEMIQHGERRLVGSYGSSPGHNRQALSALSLGKINGKDYISRRFPLSGIMEAIYSTEKRQGLKNMILF